MLKEISEISYKSMDKSMGFYGINSHFNFAIKSNTLFLKFHKESCLNKNMDKLEIFHGIYPSFFSSKKQFPIKY